jgi:hypothetical protein
VAGSKTFGENGGLIERFTRVAAWMLRNYFMNSTFNNYRGLRPYGRTMVDKLLFSNLASKRASDISALLLHRAQAFLTVIPSRAKRRPGPVRLPRIRPKRFRPTLEPIAP